MDLISQEGSVFLVKFSFFLGTPRLRHAASSAEEFVASKNPLDSKGF